METGEPPGWDQSLPQEHRFCRQEGARVEGGLGVLKPEIPNLKGEREEPGRDSKSLLELQPFWKTLTSATE